MAQNDFITYFKRFFSGTFLSRLSGMVRDLSMAYAFGDHPSVAAFMVAFRFSNLFRRLIGEGPFQSAFIPHYEGLRVQDEANAKLFFRRLSTFIITLLLLILLFTEGGLTLLLSFGTLSEGAREIITLTAWLMPAILFICMYGLNLSLLHCCESFFLPSIAPFICNITWIGAIIYLRHQNPTLAMPTMAKWIVVGFIGQWLLTLPLVYKHIAASWKDWLKVTLTPEVKQLAKAFSYGAIGVGAVQFNTLADALFARFADLRGPTYLWYSIRLELLVLSIFGIACVSTIAPRLSRAYKAGKHSEAQSFFAISYKRIMTIMIPCTFASLALGPAAINLIFGKGHFSEIAIIKTTLCLWAYSIGLVPTTLVILFSTLFYAKGNFRLPMFISISTVGINLFLNTLFVFGFKLGAASTALATSLSAFVNCMILYQLLSKEKWHPVFSMKRIGMICLASLFASLSVLAVDKAFFQLTTLSPILNIPSHFARELHAQLAHFFTLTLAFFTGFSLFVTIFKNRDLLELFYEFFPRRKKTFIQ
jgi:putative peptidoglycan lipid II flippase